MPQKIWIAGSIRDDELLREGKSRMTFDHEDLVKAGEWLKEGTDRFLTAGWFCSDCETPDGGRMCRGCVIAAGLEPPEGGYESIPESWNTENAK